MCAFVVRLPFDCNARRPRQLEDAGAHFGRDSRIATWPEYPPGRRSPNRSEGRIHRRSPRGAGKAAPKVSFSGELPPLPAAVARRRPRSGCTILARCSFFQRSILTLWPAVRHIGEDFSSQQNQRASTANSRNVPGSVLLAPRR